MALAYPKMMPDENALWQAPIWPGQTVLFGHRAVRPAVGMPDILDRMGLGDASAVTALLRGWDAILASVSPDLVIAEFAPALILAARGRLPVISIGCGGFSLPPAAMERFPQLEAEPCGADEGPLLAMLNMGLAATGRLPLDRLTAMFQTEVEIASVFQELDPYAAWRLSPVGPPATDVPTERYDGTGDEIFVYHSIRASRSLGFWKGLVESGLPIRIYAPALTRADLAALANAGVTVEERPVSVDQIVRRSRLLFSSGGIGLVSSALMAGLPQILAPIDLEKRCTARAVLDLGGAVEVDPRMSASDLARQLRAVYDDDSLRKSAMANAISFKARSGDPDGPVVEAIERLCS